MQRWPRLAALARSYRRLLDDAGLVYPHDAERSALDADRVRAGDTLVLLGVTDLSPRQRAIIDAVSERTLALVHA